MVQFHPFTRPRRCGRRQCWKSLFTFIYPSRSAIGSEKISLVAICFAPNGTGRPRFASTMVKPPSHLHSLWLKAPSVPLRRASRAFNRRSGGSLRLTKLPLNQLTRQSRTPQASSSSRQCHTPNPSIPSPPLTIWPPANAVPNFLFIGQIPRILSCS